LGLLDWAGLGVQPGPWSSNDDGSGSGTATRNRAFELTASDLGAQFGGKIPQVVDLYVTLSKPTFAPISDGDRVAVFQIHTDSTQTRAKAKQLAGPAFIAYGSTMKFPSVALEPDQGGIDLFTGTNTAATLRVTLPDAKPAETGGVQTQSATDKLTDAAAAALPEVAKGATSAAIATIGMVVVVVVLIIAFYVGGIPSPKKA
jgi:hypothetical protein